MRVLLVGGGGREAALGYRIARSPSLRRLHATHPNPGWPDGVQVHPASTVADQVEVARKVRTNIARSRSHGATVATMKNGEPDTARGGVSAG